MSYGFDKHSVPSQLSNLKKDPVVNPVKNSAKEDNLLSTPKLSELKKLGNDMGFISREPQSSRRKPGPRRIEAQGKITLTGPKRVILRFQAYCENNDIPYWKALESLLEQNMGD